MTKTKEFESFENKVQELTDDELGYVVGGTDNIWYLRYALLFQSAFISGAMSSSTPGVQISQGIKPGDIIKADVC